MRGSTGGCLLSDKNRKFPAVVVVILFTDTNENMVFKKEGGHWSLPSWSFEGGGSWLGVVESAARQFGLEEIRPKLVGVSSGELGDSGLVSCVFELQGCPSQLPLGYQWVSLIEKNIQLNALDAEIIGQFRRSPKSLWID